MNKQNTTVRLDKFLSNAGIISRRGVKKFLKEHSVTVGDKRLTESGERIAINQEVLIDGKKVTKPGFVYFLLNKPIGVVSSTADEFGRDTVTSVIDTHERIYPVGRLDKDSHGLVLLTNDGKLTHQLIHPTYHVPKVYRIRVTGHPRKEQLEQMRRGVILDDGITLPAEVAVIKPSVISNKVKDTQEISRQVRNNNTTTLEITLHEGRNRQIRRMCEELGIPLVDLQRIAFGPLQLGNLKRGEYRALTKKEIHALQEIVKH